MQTNDAVGGSVDVAERLADVNASSVPAPHHNQSLSLRLLYAEMVRLMDRPEPLFGDEVQFVSGLRGGRVDAVKVPA
jgi:hypothetical protein